MNTDDHEAVQIDENLESMFNDLVFGRGAKSIQECEHGEVVWCEWCYSFGKIIRKPGSTPIVVYFSEVRSDLNHFSELSNITLGRQVIPVRRGTFTF